MVAQAQDKYTTDLFGLKRLGRPSKANALTGAQRQKLHREKRKHKLSVTNNEKAVPCIWCGSEIRGCEACTIGQKG